MKHRNIIIALLLTCLPILADDIITLDGTKYRNVKVTSSDPVSITIMHASGVARVWYLELPPELRKTYGYDAAKADAYLAALKAAQYAPTPQPVEAVNTQTKSTDKVDDKTQASNAGGTPTGDKTATGLPIYEGPRGGRYHISKNGNKVYERKK